MHFKTLLRWLWHSAAIISLVVCLACGALWARSLGHFEWVNCQYNHWSHENDLRTYSVSLAWYSNTLRVEIHRRRITPDYFIRVADALLTVLRERHPGGVHWDFVGDDISQELNGYPPGFFYQEFPPRNPRIPSSNIQGFSMTFSILSVRPWLPTLLTAIIPAIWFIQYRRRHGTLWKFGLRELFVAITTVAALLCVGLWLKN